MRIMGRTSGFPEMTEHIVQMHLKQPVNVLLSWKNIFN